MDELPGSNDSDPARRVPNALRVVLRESETSKEVRKVRRGGSGAALQASSS